MCIYICVYIYVHTDFPGCSGKASAYNAGDPGSGRSSGEGNGNPLQYTCLENPMDWRAIVHGVTESDTTERLHFHFHIYTCISSTMLNRKGESRESCFWVQGENIQSSVKRKILVVAFLQRPQRFYQDEDVSEPAMGVPHSELSSGEKLCWKE